jgi:hypothetical protein
MCGHWRCSEFLAQTVARESDGTATAGFSVFVDVSGLMPGRTFSQRNDANVNFAGSMARTRNGPAACALSAPVIAITQQPR